jgi:CSLREA domain-containing protein
MTRNSLSPFARRSFPYLCLALLFIAAAFLINPPHKAQAAATFTVNDLGDTHDANPGDGVCADSNNKCTLRAAVEEANALAGADAITFSVAGTITLTSGELAVTQDLTIKGPGARALTVDANQASRVFEIRGRVTLDGLTIANGKVSGGTFNDGGGILNFGTLTITNSTLTGNSASGGSFNRGGAIFNGSTLTITNSTLSDNSASGGSFNAGGAIYNLATSTITNSTLSNNSVSGGSSFNQGGGIYDVRILTITNSTLSDNSVSGGTNQGGGIYIGHDDNNGTFGTVNTRYTIIAGNTASSDGPDVFGRFASKGYNLIGKSDGSTGFTDGANGDKVGTPGSPLDPMLGPLQDNGGPTQTHALLAGSPALDAGAPIFNTTSPAGVSVGSAIVTPADMSQLLVVGDLLNIDSGLASHEQVVITAKTAITFTATFTKAHAPGFTISLAVLEHDQRGQPRPFDIPSIPNAPGGDGSDIGAFELQNRPPVASCKDITVTADGSCSANVSVADINNGSSDPDAGDAIALSLDPSSPVTSITLGLGDSLLTLYVTDSSGAQTSCAATVHVVDKTPPSISGASASPNTIWPPNGKLMDVVVSYSTADNCGAVNTTLAISSNEPTAAGDMVVVDNHHVRLRADRSASGKGRIYTITITATDQSGNSSQKSVTVSVPHDQGK